MNPVVPIALSTLLLAVACTSSPESRQKNARPIPPPSKTGTADCFYAGSALDFRVLDRSNLIVFAPNRNFAYHILIAPPATELRFTERVGFLPRDSRVCGRAGERLIVGSDDRTYTIVDVSRLTPENLTMLLEWQKSDGDGDGKAPEPEPGEAAKVEEKLESN